MTDQVGVGTASPSVTSKVHIDASAGGFANGLTVSNGTLSCPGAGTTSERFGVGAVIGGAGNFNLAIGGTGAAANGDDDCIAIGHSVTAGLPGNSNNIAVGSGCTAGVLNAGTFECIAIGDGAKADVAAAGNDLIAIGDAAFSTGLQYCISLGSGPIAGQTITDANMIAVGRNARARQGDNNIAIGNAALAGHTSGTASNLIGIGQQASARGAGDCIALGAFTTAGVTATNSNLIAIGSFADAQGADDAIVLGNASINRNASGTRVANVFVVGGVAHAATDVYFGTGIGSTGSTVPGATTIHGTGGSATVNQNGAEITLAGGLGFGAGNAGGNVRFSTGRTGSANTLTLAGFFNAADGTLSVPGAGSTSERFGINSVASATNSLAVGKTAVVTAGATGGTAVGVGATLGAAALHGVALGDAAFMNTTARGIAIGWGAGDAAVSGAADNISIGNGPVTGGHNDCIAIGDFCQAGSTTSENNDIALGNSAIIYGIRNIGIGFGPTVSTITAVDTIVLGAATADWGGVNSHSNAFIAGATGKAITDVWFGSGQNSGGSAPTVWSLRGSENWGSVSNKNGADLRIVGGRGYDGGTGGEVQIRTSNVAGGGVIGTEQIVGLFDRKGNAALGLNATTETSTDGFTYIPAGTTTGTPSGTPTTISGFVPMWYDTTANKLWIYNGGWKTTTVFA